MCDARRHLVVGVVVVINDDEWRMVRICVLAHTTFSRLWGDRHERDVCARATARSLEIVRAEFESSRVEPSVGQPAEFYLGQIVSRSVLPLYCLGC